MNPLISRCEKCKMLWIVCLPFLILWLIPYFNVICRANETVLWKKKMKKRSGRNTMPCHASIDYLTCSTPRLRPFILEKTCVVGLGNHSLQKVENRQELLMWWSQKPMTSRTYVWSDGNILSAVNAARVARGNGYGLEGSG